MAKYIFVTGGVCSSLGKGIASASIGTLLKRVGYKVFMMKLDPYLNVDPGTMSPQTHGEVFVTEDGCEADLDLGHYERFLDQPLSKLSSLTTGQVYEKVLEKEREGEFLGSDVQIIPHITNEIKERVYKAGEDTGADFVIIEIGGTVGDIEGQPYLETIRQIQQEVGKGNSLLVLLTLLPYLKTSKELKTKPTQMAVRELQRSGVFPDIIMPRSDYTIEEAHFKKISMFGSVDREAVIPAYTVKSIYEVPLEYAKYHLHSIIQRKLNLKNGIEPDLHDFEKLVEKIANPDLEPLKIGMVIKYHGTQDAYISVHEAIKAAGYAHNRKVELVDLNSEKLEKDDPKELKKLQEMDGIVVPGGFGTRGVEGKIKAAKYARENNVPYFGLCLGSQILAIEYARNVANMPEAHSAEFDPKAKDLIVDVMETQKSVRKKGGTMRLGDFPCQLKAGTKARDAYGQEIIHERHRHRWEFNNKYRPKLEKAGLIFSGIYPHENIVEIVEVDNHPFMLGSQFHPEFTSRPCTSHPLFDAFIKAAIKG